MRWVAWPHSLPVSSWPAGTWYKIMEFDSTLALPWERRSALEQQVYGVKLCAYTIITPTMQILYLFSIGRRHVPLQVWWPWLLTVSCFAARFWSLVVSVEGHHQTCLPLQESLTAHCVAMTKCMPVFEGVLLHFNVFYCSGALAMTHLSCRIIPLKFVSLPWHIQAINLLCLALTGSHWQMCPLHRHMLSIGPISWMCMRYTLGSQGMIRWWILHWASKHLQNSPQQISFIFWHRLSTCCLPPSLMTNNLAQLYR